MASGVAVNKIKLTNLRKLAPEQFARSIAAAAFDGERYVKQSFGTSPSPVGGPPGVDTGALRSSIHTEKINEFRWNIVTGVEYAAWLEFGTVKTGARPFMMPMAVWLQKNIQSYFNLTF